MCSIVIIGTCVVAFHGFLFSTIWSVVFVHSEWMSVDQRYGLLNNG